MQLCKIYFPPIECVSFYNVTIGVPIDILFMYDMSLFTLVRTCLVLFSYVLFLLISDCGVCSVLSVCHMLLHHELKFNLSYLGMTQTFSFVHLPTRLSHSSRLTYFMSSSHKLTQINTLPYS